jgi:hypothetical protein
MRFRKGNIVVHPVRMVMYNPLGWLACLRFFVSFLKPTYRPDAFTVQYFDKAGSNKVASEETHEFASSLVGGGWHFQADEVARCIRDGKTESETWSLDKSLLQMEIFDEVTVVIDCCRAVVNCQL